MAIPVSNDNIYYQHQFVMNESLEARWENNEIVSERFEHEEYYVPGTMTGTLYVRDVAELTFVISETGVFNFNAISIENIKVEEAVLTEDGILRLKTDVPFPHLSVKFTISYEYDPHYKKKIDVSFDSPPATPAKTLKRLDGSTFPAPTFENFFNHDQVRYLMDDAGTIAIWDFNSALGDTIREKYESLYVKMVELTNVIQAKGAGGFFWIVCSPEVSSIYETAVAGFAPAPYGNDENYVSGLGYPQNLYVKNSVQYCGTVNNRWRLYKDINLRGELAGKVLLGVNDYKERREHYAVLNILNFLI